MRNNRSQLYHLGVNTLFHVPGDVGGTETYLRESLLSIIKEYPELKITLFTHFDNDSLLRELLIEFPHVLLVRLPFAARIRPLRIIVEQFLLPIFVKMSGVEVLWSPGYTAPFWVNCPQAVTVHDLQYKSHPDDLTWLERTTLDALVKTACKRCEVVIAVSEFSRSEIIKYRFADSEKICAILEGVDRSFSVPVVDDESLNTFKTIIPEHQPYILCVAHSYPHKNIDLLVDAFRHIKDRVSHNLVIIGKPRLGESKLEMALQRFGPSSRIIRMQKGVSFDILRLLYQKAELFVLPSSYEGFGLPVLEAMMASTSVVAAKRASIPEVGGEFVDYFDSFDPKVLGEAIINTLDKPTAYRQETREKAFGWAQGFTWNNSARKTVQLLCTLLPKKSNDI